MKTLLASTAIALALAATPASADIVRWGEAAGWTVSVDTDAGNGCFASGSFTNGDTVMFGVDSGRLFLGFTGQGMQGSAEYGKTYNLVFQFDDKTPWKAPFVAQGSVDYVELYAFGVKPSIVNELARSRTMYVHDGARVHSYSLTGSYAALAEVFECQRAMDGLSAPTAELVPEKRA